MNEKKPVYNLEERTLQFAIAVKIFTKKLPRTIENSVYIQQLTRAAASIGANYIEANENLGTKDKRMKMKISRKESKEARFFVKLVETDNNKMLEAERNKISQEATELMNIFGAILKKIE
jgi:four helix bundle protein